VIPRHIEINPQYWVTYFSIYPVLGNASLPDATNCTNAVLKGES